MKTINNLYTEDVHHISGKAIDVIVSEFEKILKQNSFSKEEEKYIIFDIEDNLYQIIVDFIDKYSLQRYRREH